MNKPVKFVNIDSNQVIMDNYLLEKMAHKIASEAHISPNVVSKYSQQAIIDWEHRTGQSIVNLAKMSSVDRSANLYNILNDFRSLLEPIVPSVKILDKSMCIASVSMEIMLNP